MDEVSRCELCGEPMPPGEEIFKYHGYSGSCPKPPLRTPDEITYQKTPVYSQFDWDEREKEIEAQKQAAQIDVLEKVQALILRRTEIPADAKNPTRDATVQIGELLVDLIEDTLIKELTENHA